MRRVASRGGTIAIALGLLLGLAPTGCSRGGETPKHDGFRVALLTPGPVSDGGWNASAYEGLQRIGKELGADSLHYLSVEGLMKSVPSDPGINYCTACFTGRYPVQIELNANKYSTEE
ncbi:MAG: hypothetical protein ACKOBV_07470 [Candidatus Kapaibacterium sp.]